MNARQAFFMALTLLTLAACSAQSGGTPAITRPAAQVGVTATAVSAQDTAVSASPTTAPVTEPPQSYPAAATLPPPEANSTAAGYPEPPVDASALPWYGYRILQTYPHDRSAYTQGLVVEDSGSGVLLESTGLYGESSLRRVLLEDGAVLQIRPLADEYFGEGIAVVEDRIVQVTWQSGTGFVYDRETFEVLQEFKYPHQGWGVAYDGRQLIVSDGTDILHFWDPETLQETGSLRVRDEKGPVVYLNELEIVEGEIWANVYQTDLIARIDPVTGDVIGWIDLSGLLAPEDRDGTEDVLNGIAYDGEHGRLFVTGKRWPLLFEIELTGPEVR
jgi:glutamine cyclotransferase